MTLTGQGDRAHLGTPDTGLDTHVQDVVALLETEELTGVVLVGHSYAGAVVGGVAGRVPERIARLVYLDAIVLEPGHSIFGDAPYLEEPMQASADAAGDGWRVPVVTDEELTACFGDHGMTADDRRWFRAHGVPQPIRVSRDVLPPAALAERVARTYVRCTATPGESPVRPGQRGWDYAELPTGHWPMLTMPAELTALLDREARR